MKSGAKLGIVAVLGVAVALTLALRGGKRTEHAAGPAPAAVASAPAPSPAGVAPAASPAPAAPAAALARPRLLELGSNRCQSCQEMAKVLDALRASQGDRLAVEFVDVFEQPEAADRHAIKLIPTQILFDAAGKEIYRHTGYFAHDDILAKFRELGVRL